MRLDLRAALNAVSDVVQNRPQPLREFDQIYMKVGDVVVYSEFLARKLDKKRVVFVGDGDAIGLCICHLANEGLIEYGPAHITILDFDERLVRSVNKFARDLKFDEKISARLYNVVDPLPAADIASFDAFHTNPPWGQHNDGASVVAFLERGIQLTKVGGAGAVVIADDITLPWTQNVIQKTQFAALKGGLILAEMIPALHAYHLDDAPELRSCTMLFRKIIIDGIPNEPLQGQSLENFYGRRQSLRIRYVRDVPRISADKAVGQTYFFEKLEP